QAAEDADKPDDGIDDAGAANQSDRKVGYFGPYYESVAARLVEAGGRALLDLPEPKRASAIGKAAAAVIMRDIQQTMSKMRVEFDVWFNEADLVTSNAREAGIAELKAAGYTEERDGALWAKTSNFGDQQDWVIVKSDGTPTYFASDVAYMRDKFS